MNDKQTGRIKRLTDKKYGFITPDDGGKDLFFHSTELVGVTFEELSEGDAVSFEAKETEKGMNAVAVSRV